MFRMLQALRPVPLPESLLRLKEQQAHRERHLTAHQAATDVWLWLASEGMDGWLTSNEIDDAWDVRRDMLEAAHIPHAEVREALLSINGVRHKRSRLAGAEFSDVRRRLRAMGKTVDRCCVYYIPKLPENMEISGCPPSGHPVAGQWPASDRTERPEGGQGVASGRADGGRRGEAAPPARWPGIGGLFGGRAA